MYKVSNYYEHGKIVHQHFMNIAVILLYSHLNKAFITA